MESGEGRRDGLGWAAGVVAGTTILLAAVNAQSARNWLDLQPPDAWTSAIVPTVEAWSRATAAIGLDAPRRTLARAWEAAKTAPWPIGAPVRAASNKNDTRH